MNFEKHKKANKQDDSVGTYCRTAKVANDHCSKERPKTKKSKLTVMKNRVPNKNTKKAKAADRSKILKNLVPKLATY